MPRLSDWVARLPAHVSNRVRESRWVYRRLSSALGNQILVPRLFPPNTTRLIVFLTPGREFRSGGILSIVSLYEESRALAAIHESAVALCTVPGDPPLLKYTWFKNRSYILDLHTVLEQCRGVEALLLHVPEYAVNPVVEWAHGAGAPLLRRIRDVHINVMLQNIDVIQGQRVDRLRPLGRVTATTAHEAYTNATTRAKLGIPLHRLSVMLYPERYRYSPYGEKRSVLIVSPDSHPDKVEILDAIQAAMPELSIITIQHMRFETYLEHIHRAKWSLTFGEGLDGYFAEPVFCGAVAFAVFNDRFFTPAFRDLPTVYDSWPTLTNRIVSDMRRLDEAEPYQACWREIDAVLRDLYSVQRTRENLRQFYIGNYTFP